MRIRGLGAEVLVVTAGVAVSGCAGPGPVERTIPLNLRTPTGLAWDGRYLWVAGLDTATLKAVDPASGKIVATQGAGDSETLGWDYNSRARWTARGRVKLMTLRAGDWVPAPSPTAAREDTAP